MAGGSGLDSAAVRQAQAPSKSRGARRRPATITWVIAVKNRSHNL